jgi:hypothetical protein
MSLPMSLCSSLFAAVYKRPTEGLKEGVRFLLFAFGFCFEGFFGLCLLAFALGFFVWEVFVREKNY